MRFATEDGVFVLDSLSFGLPSDGFVFVVGPPASGKTLLLKLILREAVPTGGQILVLRRNMARLSPRRARELRRRIGYMPDPPHILTERSIQANLEFKLRALGFRGAEAGEHLARALEAAGLADRENLLASSLDELGKRRLALALAMCPEPAVLLCDDPFRALVPADQDELVRALLRINEWGVAVLATARDPDLPQRHGFLPKGSEPSLRYVLPLSLGVRR